ncbi:MAG: nucleoside hydrolase-like domain-containing protein [Candidatus Cryptobacteroides sp.]
MKKALLLIAGLAALVTVSCENEAETETFLPRTIITTDGEVDDIDSFIRLLMYSNEMDIRAIVYTSSKHHWAGDNKGTRLLPQNRFEGPQTGFPQAEPEPMESYRWIGMTWIQEHIDKYEKCYPNLIRHDDRYPSPDYLRSILKIGNVVVEGDMEEPTEGSDFIKNIILDDDPSPIYVQLWGGTNTLARALLSIEEEYRDTPQWKEIHSKVSGKVVLNIIQDQDGTYRNYVAKVWPDIRTIYNQDQFLSFAYLWTSSVPQDHKPYLSGKWFTDNIINDHGPLAGAYLGLGSGYNLNDPGDHFGNPEMAKRMKREINEFISEGDSPSYFVLFDWGLRSIDHPEWGGLGGRFYKSDEGNNFYRDPHPEGGFVFRPRHGQDDQQKPKITFDREVGDYNPQTGEADMWYPQTRWVKILQNDFASRADWCVSDYADANHRPVIKAKNQLDLYAEPGESITLKTTISDPDGDKVSVKWWQYREAGTSDSLISFNKTNGSAINFNIPADAVAGTTLHIIAEATDDGSPELTSFLRFIITIE